MLCLRAAGDILSLVEKAEESIQADEAQRVTQRLLAAKFDFNDFLAQFKMMNNMGSMGAVMKMLPGAGRNSQTLTLVVHLFVSHVHRPLPGLPGCLPFLSQHRLVHAQGSGGEPLASASLWQTLLSCHAQAWRRSRTSRWRRRRRSSRSSSP